MTGGCVRWLYMYIGQTQCPPPPPSLTLYPGYLQTHVVCLGPGWVVRIPHAAPSASRYAVLRLSPVLSLKALIWSNQAGSWRYNLQELCLAASAFHPPRFAIHGMCSPCPRVSGPREDCIEKDNSIVCSAPCAGVMWPTKCDAVATPSRHSHVCIINHLHVCVSLYCLSGLSGKVSRRILLYVFNSLLPHVGGYCKWPASYHTPDCLSVKAVMCLLVMFSSGAKLMRCTGGEGKGEGISLRISTKVSQLQDVG